MSKEFDEILAVLKMSKGEQWTYLRKAGLLLHPWENLRLGNLAFRLRAEARQRHIELWNIAIVVVALRINDSPQLKEMYVSQAELGWAQTIILNQDEYPVYLLWIIAALMAKSLERNNGKDI